MQTINTLYKISRGREKPYLIILLLLSVLLIGACSDNATPEPSPVPTATTALAIIAEPTETASSQVSPTASSTVEIAASPSVVSAASAGETATDTGTITSPAVTSPTAGGSDTGGSSAARDADGACLTESALDLAGYPNLEESMGCAIQEASFDPVAINEFGEGPEYDRFMLWLSKTGQIIVLLSNATWQGYLDTWTEGEAEIQCNPYDGPTESPPLPRRGFGKLWCSNPEVQEQMGTIEREERLCQHAVIQRFEQGRLIACFEDATIRYFRILEDGSWDHLFVQ